MTFKKKFLIKNHCIACTTCSSIAPTVFKVNEKGTGVIILKQPESLEVEKKAMNALKTCPVFAIGVTNDNS